MWSERRCPARLEGGLDVVRGVVAAAAMAVPAGAAGAAAADVRAAGERTLDAMTTTMPLMEDVRPPACTGAEN
jgi:hypothetical protein